MMQNTRAKAYRFVREGDVTLHKDSISPHYFHFDVDGTDVYRRIDSHGNISWICNAVSDKGKEPWGCVMSTKNRTIPTCSHTLSAKLYLEIIFRREYSEDS